MKTITIKLTILISLGLVILFSLLLNPNLSPILGLRDKREDQNDYVSLKFDKLKISKISDRIYINSADPINNWSVAKEAGICTGNGTYSEPYVIQDLIISKSSGICILINNSNVYFKIQNCTLYTNYIAIRLINVKNSKIINSTVDACTGIFLSNCENNSISENTVNLNECCGISLENSNNNTISENLINNNYHGISLEFSDNNTISGNRATNNYRYGIISNNSNTNKFIINNLTDHLYGIYLINSNYNTISGNNAIDNHYGGFYLSYCEGNTISYNYGVVGEHDFGIWVDYSDNNTITENIWFGNIIKNKWADLVLRYSNFCIITANVIQDGYLYFLLSNNNTISGNVINNSKIKIPGIILYDSYNTTITANLMYNCGMDLESSFQGKPHLLKNLEYLINGITSPNEVDTTNLVNGKPLYYYDSKMNLEPRNFTNAGQAILVNCTNSLISNLNISYSLFGIELFYCSNNTISGNSVQHNGGGIYLKYSRNNTLSENIANNNNIGIYFYISNDNNISGNWAEGNNYGIFLRESNENFISGNTLKSNYYGIYLSNSNMNIIKGNILTGNDRCIYETPNSTDNVFLNNVCEQDYIIHGYNLLFLLGISSVGIIISLKIVKKT
jgi:parallel beta-helix repeat protein